MEKESFYQKHKELLGEIFRFLLVGGLATLVDFGIYELFFYVLLKNMTQTWNIILSTAAGFLVGNLVNYLLSIIFVFKGAKEDKKTQTAGAFLLFTIIGVLGLGIKTGLQLGGHALIDLMAIQEGFWSWFADTFVYGVATLIVLIWNYVGRKLLIFKHSKEEVK